MLLIRRGSSSPARPPACTEPSSSAATQSSGCRRHRGKQTHTEMIFAGVLVRRGINRDDVVLCSLPSRPLGFSSTEIHRYSWSSARIRPSGHEVGVANHRALLFLAVCEQYVQEAPKICKCILSVTTWPWPVFQNSKVQC